MAFAVMDIGRFLIFIFLDFKENVMLDAINVLLKEMGLPEAESVESNAGSVWFTDSEGNTRSIILIDCD